MCWQILAKLFNVEFYEDPFTGSQVVTCGDGQTDRHDEANGAFFKLLVANTLKRRLIEAH